MVPGMAARPSTLACLWLALATALTAQISSSSSPQQPTFRTGIQSVRVDLYATLNGQPVTDLRQDEIRLLEDGTPQAIQTFERIVFAPPSAITPAEPKTLEDSRRLASDPHSRLFVLFLPTPDAGFDLGPTSESRRLLVEPVNGMLGPDDLIAVMTPYTRIGDLTFHRRVPLNNTRFLSNTEVADPKHRLWDVCYPPGPGSPNAEMKARHLELITFEALDALVEHLGGLREERKHILLVTDGFLVFTPNPALAARSEPAPVGFPRGRGPEGIGIISGRGDTAVVTSGTRRECEADLNALASIDHRNRLEEIGQRASRNNLSFTTVSLARMQTSNGRTGAARSATNENATTLARQSSLQALAGDTGGVAIVNTNDITGRLRDMMRATSAYYLLGYTSTNAASDGKFRRITVRIDRPGVRVHARPGYLAAKPAAVGRLDSREAARSSAIDRAVALVAGNVTNRPLRNQAAAWMRASEDGQLAGVIWIVGELDSQARSTGDSAGNRIAQITVQTPDGGPAISRKVEIPAGAAAFEVQLDEGMRPGDYSARVSVTSADEEPLREIVRVSLPHEPAPLGEPILLRRGPATRQRYLRTADLRFQRNDRLRIEIPTNGADTVSATLRDSTGAALPVPITLTERADDSGTWRWVVADVPLAALAPAVYAVEVRQGGVTRATAFRLVSQ